MPVVDVSVHHAVIIAVGPNRAGETADGRADHRALKDANARKNRADSCADGGSAKRARGGAGKDTVGRRVIALRRAGIILTIVDIAVDIAVIVGVGPGGAGETADCCADRGAFDHAYTRNHRTDGGTARGTDRRALGNPRVARARAENRRAGKRQG